MRPIFFEKAPAIKSPVWAMIFVNDKADVMSAERLREAAQKIFEKMGWA